MTYLLDTNVVSQAGRRRPDHSVLEWLAKTSPHERHLSVLTLGELRRWVELRRRTDTVAAVALEQWVGKIVASYGRRIVPVTSEVAQRWGLLGVPDPVPDIDGLLAATALVHDWTVVTRNAADFERTGVRTLNPFQSQ
ncbi:MAG TPA: type II toxin-antitoxin system VapC family toxin [Jatrophihabitantaceae bacterium]|nr:type II toxin-antitoxin system VapC family toxin [Jatrophihabitantaceae bacterium]